MTEPDLASMFKHGISRAAIDALAAEGRAELDGKAVVAAPRLRRPSAP